jgi:predicted RNA methylase
MKVNVGLMNNITRVIMEQQIENADHLRRKVSSGISRKHKSELGQFMTPMTVARYMASLFQENNSNFCRLLDAGAGLGALTSAFLDRIKIGELAFQHIEVDAYEIDSLLRSHL